MASVLLTICCQYFWSLNGYQLMHVDLQRFLFEIYNLS